MSSPDVGARETGSKSDMLDQPFASSEMGLFMDSDSLTEFSRETWVAATHLDEATGAPSGSEPDLITASRIDSALLTVRNGSRPVRLHLGRTVLGYSRNFVHGIYNLIIYQYIPMVVCGVAEHLQRWHHSWWYQIVNEGVSFSDTMIPYLPDIWVFSGLCVCC